MHEIVLSLRKNAYALIENAVSEDIVNNILAVTASPVVSVNGNDLSTVIQGNTQFFTNIVAHSRVVYDIITSPLVINLCTTVLGDHSQLVNNRIQTTRAQISMPWHTDNNLLSNGKLVGRHDMPGLQFVLYLTSVSAAPFLFIKGSHEWSLNHKNQYLSDEVIVNSGYEIVELVPPPGSLLILNTHLFHRASPIRKSSYMRSILLFQVDDISANYPYHGEKLFVNPAFLDNFSPQISSFLGFGRTRSYPPFPESSFGTLDLNHAYFVLLKLLRSLPILTLKALLKRILTADVLAKVKNFYVVLNTKFLVRKSFPSRRIGL